MRTAIVSTYPPRACGIGTFAADLRGTLIGVDGVESVDLVAVVNEPSSPQRRGVLATIAQAVRGDYVRTARMLGRLDVDVVLLQHEYGIFGGRDGEYVLSFAQELAQPLVVTLHTVLSEPTPHQAEVLTELCAEAELVIVMTETALRLLVGSGACPEEKVRVVPHGAPARITARAAGDREALVSSPSAGGDAFQLSTFGLISPGKGLETVIEALPAMIERHPEIVYTIAGRTHPGRRASGRRAIPADARTARTRARPRRACRVRRPVPLDRRALGPARRDRCLRDAVRQPGADRLGRAHLRDRRRLRRRLDSVLVRAGHARVGRRPARRSVRRSGCARRRRLRATSSSPRRSPRRAAEAQPDRLVARVAGGRAGDRARACARRCARTAAPAGRRRGPAPDEPAHRPPAHARRRRRDRPARARNHPQPRQRLLRRRRRPAGRRLARARPPRRRAALDVDPLPRTRLPPRGHRRRRDAQLHELRPSLARRAARRRPRRPVDLGARRDPRHRVGTCRRAARPATCSTGSSERSPARSRCERPRIPCSASPASTRTGSSPRPIGCSSGSSTSSPTHTSAPHRRTGAGSRTSSATTMRGSRRRCSAAATRSAAPDLAELGLESLRWLGDECGLDGDALRLPGHRGRRRGEPCAGHRRRAAARRRGIRRGRAEPLLPSPARPSTASGRPARSSGSSGRNRLQRPLYDFATGGCSDGLGSEALNQNEGAESTLAFHRAALLLDAAGVRAAVRERALEPAAA